ncbi:hypothetical protein EE612_007935 [Oryza sativa]|nr:hypothetical protein EE612_007935 [Oryza sativa]
MEHPRDEAEQQHATDGHRRVVERLLGHRIRHRQREEHRDGGHPDHGHPADHEPISPEVKLPRNKRLPSRRHAEKHRQRVRDVQPQRGDRHHRLERHLAPQRRESHDEGHGDGEPDDVEGHLAAVHAVPHARQRHRAVPRERVPHPRVAGDARGSAEEDGDGDDTQAGERSGAGAVPPVEAGVQGLRDGVPAGVVAGVQEVRYVGHDRCQGNQVDPPEHG